MVERICERDEF